MKKRQVFILLFLSILFLSFEIKAQIKIRPEKTFYDGLLASNSTKKLVDFNLKGNIKKVIEISLSNNDSTLFYFNPNGLLEKQFISNTKELTVYSYESNQLRSISFEEPRSKYGHRKYFNHLGFIEKEISDRIDYSDTIHKVSTYFFNEKKDELNIHYKYNIDTLKYDVVLNDFYVFTFNIKNQVIKERSISKHLKSEYKSTTNYEYDSISGNLIYSKISEDCAFEGYNSCSNVEIFIKYDNHNNIISKALSDHTIRNSSWKSNYLYSAKYNENDDIIEEYYTDNEDFQRSTSNLLFTKPPKKRKTKNSNAKVIADITTKPIFEYAYDLKGNWIKKYKSFNGSKKLIKSRIIEYYN